MREVFLQAGWDVLLFAVPFLAMLLISFSRLNRLISAIQDEEKASWSEFERPAWDLDPERPFLSMSDPDAVPRPGAGCP